MFESIEDLRARIDDPGLNATEDPPSAQQESWAQPMSSRFVAGDWGTTNLRLFLCDDSGAVLGTIFLKSNGAHANSCKRCRRHASSKEL